MGNTEMNNNTGNLKIGVFVHHPAPYRDNTFKEFIKLYNDFLEIYTIDDYAPTHIEWEYYGSDVINVLGSKVHFPIVGDYNIGLLNLLRKKKFDLLLISGYYPASMLSVLIFSIVTSTPYVLAMDTISRSKRRLLQSIAIKKASAIWTTGKKGKEFLVKLGVDADKIFEGLYTYDTRELSESIFQYDKEKQRKNLGIESEDMVFLFIGKLITSRKIEILLAAVQLLHMNGVCGFKVIIIGDGKEKYIVEKYVKNYTEIIYIPSVPYSGIHKYYRVADVYVHPGSEPYSLAVVEACIAENFIITSRNVGASADVLVDKVNGYYFDGTTEDLVNKMNYLIKQKPDFDEIKKYSKKIIKYRGIDWAAKQLNDAFEMCVKG